MAERGKQPNHASRSQLPRREFLTKAAFGGIALLGLGAAGCGENSPGGVPDGALSPDGGGILPDGSVAIDGAQADGSSIDGSLVDGNAGDGSVADASVTDSRLVDTSLLPDATPACLETEDNILGPYFKEGAPQRSSLVSLSTVGTRLSLSGFVFRRSGMQCAPAANVRVDLWQANDAGAYDGVGFNFRGHIVTDSTGAYRFDTILPGRYLNGAQYRPAHLHFMFRTGATQNLVTQLYFAGDPFNSIDPWYKPELLVVPQTGRNGLIGTYHFVLA